MNYQEMTDDEINLAVAEARFGIKAVLEDYWYGDIPQLYYRESGEVLVQSGNVLSGEWHTFDPINLWGQAGQIAQENKISVLFDEQGMCHATHEACWVDGVEWQIDGIVDENPCRAICIVFLMMKGGE